MTSIRRMIGTVAGLVVILGGLSAAHAQATRTWVSGVGDDVNPCSRTAPCKTFAGAISKTAAGGEINVLDPGGFGSVTITKSITISSEGIEAGVLASGTSGIVVNAAATDVVVLRGLDIEGIGTGLSGINFIAGGALHVEKCTINHFTTAGINFVPNQAAASKLFVKDTIVRNNVISAPNGGAILIKPIGGGSVKASLDTCRLESCLFGLRAEDNSKVTVHNSVAAGNSGNGFLCVSVAAAAELNLDNCVATNTTTNGIATSGAAATVRISNCVVTDNGTGLNHAAGGMILSYSNNNVDDASTTTGLITPK